MYLYISLLNNWFNRLQSHRFNCNQGINIENKLTGSQNLVGPVCARHHQQPGWGCESWTQTDRFDHNGFRKRPLIACHTGDYYINWTIMG